MSEAMQKQVCQQCAKSFSGNENKKFCGDKCKNDHHNRRRKIESLEIGDVVNILKVNRRVLAELLGDQATKKVSAQRLMDKGFNFHYHTHHRVNKGDAKEYIFCFDYGYLQLPSGWYMIVLGFKEGD
jgi:hypothetical protein